MTAPLVPSEDDLAAALQDPTPESAGHVRAEAVSAGDGSYTLVASTGPSGTVLVELDDAGDVRATRRLDGCTGRALAHLAGGGLVVAGEVRDDAMHYRGSLHHLDADGTVVARRVLGPPGPTGFAAVAALVDGSIVAGGATAHGGWIVRTGADLKPVWELSPPGTGAVHAVAALSDGGFAVAATGPYTTTGPGTARLMVLSADGEVRWQHAGDGELTSLVVDGAAGLIAGGHRATAGPARLWLLRVDPHGQAVWDRDLGGAGEHRGRAVAAYPDGGVAMAGDAWRDDRRHLCVARLNPDGAVQWEREPGDVVAAAGLAVTPDGGLLVVGTTRPAGATATRVRALRLTADGQIRGDRTLTLDG